MSDPSAPETVAVAREKFHCPTCGAEAHWNPAKNALICPFCGTESPVTLETRGVETVIVEHDLAAALRSVPHGARGWRAQKISARCQSCRAISVFDAAKVGQRCEFCGSAQLLPYEDTKEAFTPESLLPFKVAEPQARDLVRAWYRRQWLAPSNLGSKALTDTAKGIYLPHWTFDAKADASWTADSGKYYYTRERGKRVRRIEWTPASGSVSHVFDDELVHGSTGVDADLLRKVEPFPTETLVPYDPGYLAGWTVERYQIDLADAAARSRERMDETLRKLCAADVRGDTHRNLVVNATFSDERFKHILVPIWLLTYTYGSKSYQIAINGVTGKIAGGRPWSWTKITLLVLVILLVLVPLVRVAAPFLPELLPVILELLFQDA